MQKKFNLRSFVLNYNVFIIFTVLFVVCSFASKSFLLPINLINICLQQCYPVFVAIGMLFPIEWSVWKVLTTVAMVLAVILTVYSFIDYLLGNKNVLKDDV